MKGVTGLPPVRSVSDMAQLPATSKPSQYPEYDYQPHTIQHPKNTAGTAVHRKMSGKAEVRVRNRSCW